LLFEQLQTGNGYIMTIVASHNHCYSGFVDGIKNIAHGYWPTEGLKITGLKY
ncbi:MAG: hypothetical protein RLZZ04_3765, partial [Cyanobacteriota bacterium]